MNSTTERRDWTVPATNSDLLGNRWPDTLLTGIERQKRYVLRMNAVPMPCPACRHEQSVFEAAGIDVDAYDFGVSERKFHCSSCGRELRHDVLVIGGWRWGLVDPIVDIRIVEGRDAQVYDTKEAAQIVANVLAGLETQGRSFFPMWVDYDAGQAWRVCVKRGADVLGWYADRPE